MRTFIFQLGFNKILDLISTKYSQYYAYPCISLSSHTVKKTLSLPIEDKLYWDAKFPLHKKLFQLAHRFAITWECIVTSFAT